MKGSQSQPPFSCDDDEGVLETLVVPPKDDSVIDDLLDVNDGSVFYGDFHLPEFPCMSSSSSSSSTPAPAKPAGSSPTSSSASLVGASASSSSATSWAMLHHVSTAFEEMENRVLVPVGIGSSNGQSEALASTASMEIILEKPSEEDATAAATAGTSSTAAPVAMSAVDECMDVMENFGYMELLEGDDMFDPTSIFQSDNLLDQEVQHMGCFGQDHEDQNYHQDLIGQPHEKDNEAVLVTDTRHEDVPGVEVKDDMGTVFLEWLRANRDSISVEDLRKVKIKKSTIETAARRLGGGKEAMKQLLKLILEWVQTNHLPRKYAVESSSAYPNFDQQFIQSNPNPNFAHAQLASTMSMFADPNTSASFFASQWAPPPSLFPHPGMDPSSAAIGAYRGGEQMDFQMVDSSQSWPAAVQWPSNEYLENFQTTMGSPQGFGGGFGYPSQYPLQYFGAGSSHTKFTRMGSLATKEARKKRMARQRRLLSHHHHRHPHPHHVGNSHRQDSRQLNVTVEQTPEMMGSENYCTDASQLDGNANWMYWPPSMQGDMAASDQLQVQPTEVVPTVHPPAQSFQRPVPSQQPDRRQGWKPESNLKFLLQKVLKQSDVGNLGRIVLPKKEAETHLPELEARDGISIAMEDIGTSRVWNMRYRFWPNNKSRMYLLENTGDFVRTNGLEEGDFIVIYSDVKCGKYLIRGVKVRPPEGATKASTKRAEKAQIRSNNNAGSGSAAIVPGTGK